MRSIKNKNPRMRACEHQRMSEANQRHPRSIFKEKI